MKILRNPPQSKFISSMIPFVVEKKPVEEAAITSDHDADKPLDLGDVKLNIDTDSQLT